MRPSVALRCVCFLLALGLEGAGKLIASVAGTRVYIFHTICSSKAFIVIILCCFCTSCVAVWSCVSKTPPSVNQHVLAPLAAIFNSLEEDCKHKGRTVMSKHVYLYLYRSIYTDIYIHTHVREVSKSYDRVQTIFTFLKGTVQPKSCRKLPWLTFNS